MADQQAKARNQQLILATGAITIAAVFASSYLLEKQPMGSINRLALALLPLPFSLLMLAVYVRLVRLWPLMAILWVPALFYSYWRYR